jgi:hypothetical protein
VEAWRGRKADAEAQENRVIEQRRQIEESYNKDLANYEARNSALAAQGIDVEDAISAVAAKLTLEQQAVAIQAASDPAALAVALNRSPSRLEELAKIHNPWKLAAAIARMEGSVKVTKKKAPAPNRPLAGSASMADANVDKELQKLEAEAARTGVRTKVIAYKKQLKEKGNA